MGFVPGLPDVALEPELVLVIFLPPLLYSAAFFANLHDLKRDVRAISLLAIGLVLATMCTVAVVAHALVDGLPWAAAFALGAIVAPTDPVAATTVARRLAVPRRVVSVIEGESLVNDGTALVAYRVAVAAAVGGGFSLWEAGLEFVLGATGGILIGPRHRLGHLRDPPPARRRPGRDHDLPADAATPATCRPRRSARPGVLAAVTVGIVLGWRAPRISSARMRLAGLRRLGHAGVPAQRAAVRADRVAAAAHPRRARRASRPAR